MPPPPFDEGLAGFEDAVRLPVKAWSVSVLVKNGIKLEGDIDTEGDADNEETLSKDAVDVVGEIEGVLAGGDCDVELVIDAKLLPEALEDVELSAGVVTCNASADAPDPYGYAGTEKPLGNGGTAGTWGKASVGKGGTAGTCGNDGTGGVEGTAGSTASRAPERTRPAAESTAFTTGDATGATGAITAPNESTIPGVGVAGTPGVFVSWPIRLPLESTVATTSTLTVTTLVAGCACRR